MNAIPRSVAVVAGWALAAAAFAQPYPNRPIRFITVGSSEVMPRMLAQVLSGSLGQQVYIEEHAGAAGTIGAGVAARAPPDGYTFLIATGAHTVTHHFFKVSYDILHDFEPVSLVSSNPFVLLSHPSLPVRTLEDLIKLAQARPGQLNYSATSAGSPTMLTFEMFKAKAHVNIVHVPYKSVAAALADAVAGQVPLNVNSLPLTLPQIQAHRVRALAVSTPTRSVILRDVPTFVEQGLPEVVSLGWSGLLAPAKTAPSIIAHMNAEVVNALRTPQLRERILALAMEPGGNTPEEFRAYMKADLARWAEVVKVAKIPTITQQR
jgi:tripartite-type tricarboxylate transporter receptor subunit TctC